MEGEQLSGPASSGLQQLYYRDLTLRPGACLSARPPGVLAATSEDRRGRVAKKVDPGFFSGPQPCFKAPPLSPLLPSQSLLHCLDAALLPTLPRTSVRMCLCMCECVNKCWKRQSPHCQDWCLHISLYPGLHMEGFKVDI